MSILNKIKEKPILYGGGAVVVAIGLYLLLQSGGSQTVSSDGLDPSTVAAADALQQAQLQANQAANQTSAAVQANQDTIAGQTALQTIQTQSQDFIANLEANIASQQINAHSQDSALQNTLEAQVANNQINANTEQLSISTAAQVQNTQTLANALVAESTNQANVAIAGINASGCKGLFCF